MIRRLAFTLLLALGSCSDFGPNALQAGSYDFEATADHVYSGKTGLMVEGPGRLHGVLDLSGADAAGRPTRATITIDFCEGFQACYSGFHPIFEKEPSGYLNVLFEKAGSVVLSMDNTNNQEVVFTGGSSDQLTGSFSFASTLAAYPYATGTAVLHRR